jgi:hypothetical protein
MSRNGIRSDRIAALGRPPPPDFKCEPPLFPLVPDFLCWVYGTAPRAAHALMRGCGARPSGRLTPVAFGDYDDSHFNLSENFNASACATKYCTHARLNPPDPVSVERKLGMAS